MRAWGSPRRSRAWLMEGLYSLSIVEPTTRVDPKALPTRVTRKVMAHIEANLSGAVLVQDLARVARLSGSHFHRAFRRRFGVPPRVYIILRRIQMAQRLMLDTDDPH